MCVVDSKLNKLTHEQIPPAPSTDKDGAEDTSSPSSQEKKKKKRKEGKSKVEKKNGDSVALPLDEAKDEHNKEGTAKGSPKTKKNTRSAKDTAAVTTKTSKKKTKASGGSTKKQKRPTLLVENDSEGSTTSNGNMSATTAITAEDVTESSGSNGNDSTWKRVSFTSVDIREYGYSIGCGVTSDGPPVAISSKPLRSVSFDIEAFERDRSNARRKLQDLIISTDDRILLLERCGYTAIEIEEACWEAEKIRAQRTKSVKNMEWDGWAAASESVSRKIAKIKNAKAILFGNSSSKH